MPTDSDRLATEARDFAGLQSELLNGTVADGIRLTAVLDPRGFVRVGHRISSRDFEPKPLQLGMDAKSSVWLVAVWRLRLGPERQHLAVQHSQFAVWSSDDREDDRHCAFRYEFIRRDGAPWPESHLQVHGRSEALEDIGRAANRRQDLERFHLPVGSRRFRPCLEDVLEFLISHGLVAPRDSWKECLNESRERFLRRQLMAAVRRDPQTALDQLNASFGTDWSLPSGK